MTITPLFASDTTAALAGPIAVVFGIGLLGLGSMVVIAKWGRRSWWGLLLALFPTVVGGALLAAVMIAQALGFLYVVAAFPLLCGLCSLYFWQQRRR